MNLKNSTDAQLYPKSIKTKIFGHQVQQGYIVNISMVILMGSHR